MSEVDFGRRVLSLEEAMTGQIWCHYFGHIQTFVYVGGDWRSNYGHIQSSQIEWLITIGCFTTKAGAERHLRALQTKAEVRRMAFEALMLGHASLGPAVIGYSEDMGKFHPASLWKSFLDNPISQGSIVFPSVPTCEHCIDTIGQTRLTEVFAAQESL